MPKISVGLYEKHRSYCSDLKNNLNTDAIFKHRDAFDLYCGWYRCSYSRGTMFKKGVKSLMRMGKQRNTPDKEALIDSDESAHTAAVPYQKGHATETSDLSSDNESISSLNAEFSPKPRKLVKSDESPTP